MAPSNGIPSNPKNAIAQYDITPEHPSDSDIAHNDSNQGDVGPHLEWGNQGPDHIPPVHQLHDPDIQLCHSPQATEHPPLSHSEYLKDLYNEVRASGVYNFAGVQRRVPSGLNIHAWREYLRGYKDPHLVDYLEYGWPINFDRTQPLHPAYKNHFSANAYPDHVTHYVQTELAHGALLGPFTGPPVIDVHLSPLMTKRKKDSPHRRVIVDLSFPQGGSVNDGIHPSAYIDGPLTVKLPTVHSMERKLLDLGPGAFLYKTDLARGYRQLRVDPGDWGILAFQHEGLYYMDLCPPFGLRSSAMMMVRTTEAITSIHADRGYMSMAYIDDFGGAERDRSLAQDALASLQGILRELGMDEATAKVCEPSQVMTWLGIRFDSVAMTMTLPQEKVEEVAETLRQWDKKQRANLREVQSLFGLLQFVTSVAPTAKVFTNRILDTMRELGAHGYTNLSWGFRRDLKFFQDLIPQFRGVKIIAKTDIPAQHSLELDACLSGCGAICGDEFYGRQFPSAVSSQLHPIAHLEILNIVVALKLWTDSWRGHRIRVTCDNLNSVQAIHTGRSRDTYMQQCIREIYLYCAIYDIELLASHAPGSTMHRADALSREHLGERYAKMVADDPGLRAASRLDPDDRFFILINEL